MADELAALGLSAGAGLTAGWRPSGVQGESRRTAGAPDSRSVARVPRRQTWSRRWLSVLALFLVFQAWTPHEGADAGVVIASGVLGVGAGVNVQCNFTTTALNFGTYIQTDPAPHDVTANFSVYCTASNTNHIVHIRFGQGLWPGPGSTNANPMRRMSNGSTGRLNYNIYRDAARTQIWGNTPSTGHYPGTGPYPTQIPVYGRIPPLQAVVTGNYTDNVLITFFF